MPSKYEIDSFTAGANKVHTEFKAGTSGAVPATLTRARGIKSITKGTHKYTYVLHRGATALLDWSCKVIQASPDVDGAWEAKVTAETVSGSTKSIEVSIFAADGTAVDLATGDVLKANFELKTSPGLA